MAITFQLNGAAASFDGDPDMPLLWHVREDLGLTGTKFGCGAALCGACTVHIDGVAMRSCSVPMSAVAGSAITTIEGADSRIAKAVKQAWIETDVAQCGYCQPGMIMAVTALLAATPAPSDAEIDASLDNLCRCGTYNRIRTAIHDAARRIQEGN